MSRSIQHGRNLARDAHATSGILVELALTGLGCDNFWHSVSRFLFVGHGKAAFSFQPSALMVAANWIAPLPLLWPAFSLQLSAFSKDQKLTADS
jgi:hypothetical protein